jgi:hypothetical protein
MNFIFASLQPRDQWSFNMDMTEFISKLERDIRVHRPEVAYLIFPTWDEGRTFMRGAFLKTMIRNRMNGVHSDEYKYLGADVWQFGDTELRLNVSGFADVIALRHSERFMYYAPHGERKHKNPWDHGVPEVPAQELVDEGSR